jgi:hypothetical protein
MIGKNLFINAPISASRDYELGTCIPPRDQREDQSADLTPLKSCSRAELHLLKANCGGCEHVLWQLDICADMVTFTQDSPQALGVCTSRLKMKASLP